jgi:thiopurine S-methyltransferase
LDCEFWRREWETAEIGCHQLRVNARLPAHWPALEVPRGARVAVALCGRSLEVAWLRDAGYQPAGFALSEIVVRDFFATLAPTRVVAHHATSTCWHADGYAIWCSDFLRDTGADCARCPAFCDRAAPLDSGPSTVRG